MSSCPTLETENLILRPFKDKDVDDYFGVLDSPEVRRWLHIPESLDRSDAWQQMAWFLGQWELRGTGHWALEEKDSGNLSDELGCIDLNVMTGPVWRWVGYSTPVSYTHLTLPPIYSV